MSGDITDHQLVDYGAPVRWPELLNGTPRPTSERNVIALLQQRGLRVHRSFSGRRGWRTYVESNTGCGSRLDPAVTAYLYRLATQAGLHCERQWFSDTLHFLAFRGMQLR